VAAVFPLDYRNKIGADAFAMRPVGTGPYMVKSWAHNVFIDLVRNPEYWDARSGGPYIDKIHMPIIWSDELEWLRFEKGDLDCAQVPARQVNAAMHNAKVRSGDWTAKMYPWLGVRYVAVNMQSPLVGGDDHLALRQALAYGTERSGVIDTVMQSVPAEANGMVPRGIPGSALSRLPYSEDSGKARSLAKQAGISSTLRFNALGDRSGVAEALRTAWNDVGIKVSLDSSGGALSEDDLVLNDWYVDYPAMDDFLYPLFHGTDAERNNPSFYKNPAVDRLLDTARSTSDERQRLALYAQAEQKVLDDVAAIPLFFYRDFGMTSDRIGGFDLTPMSYVDMWKLWVK